MLNQKQFEFILETLYKELSWKVDTLLKITSFMLPFSLYVAGLHITTWILLLIFRNSLTLNLFLFFTILQVLVMILIEILMKLSKKMLNKLEEKFQEIKENLLKNDL